MLRPPLYRLYSLLRFMCTARNDATPAGTIDPYARGPPAPAVRGSSCGFDAIRQGRRRRCLRSEVPRSSRRDKTSEDRRSAERSRGGTRRGSGFEDEPVHRRYAMISVSLRAAGSTYVCSASCVAAASSPSGRIPPPHSPGGIAHSTPIHTDSERTPTESPSASPIEHQSRRRT